MKIIYHPEQRLHNPKTFLVRGKPQPSPETPERIDALLDTATAADYAVESPADYGSGPLAQIHSPEYLHFLTTIAERWRQLPGAADDVIPNIHPQRHSATYPQSPVGQAGYHMADTACPIGADTWRSAQASANTAIHAARKVLLGDAVCYALCRPPGHHAYADMAGGFCYLNNTALAAQELRSRYARVAILDVDVHHGNGTQGIFYARNDVLTLSIHADPHDFYPFFWGHASERGEGQGLGYNLNLPLPRLSGDEVFLNALATALERIRLYQPGALVVALGLDAYVNDPLAGLSITTQGFGRIAEAISRLGLPSVLVQEGGYPCPELGANLVSFLQGFER